MSAARHLPTAARYAFVALVVGLCLAILGCYESREGAWASEQAPAALAGPDSAVSHAKQALPSDSKAVPHGEDQECTAWEGVMQTERGDRAGAIAVSKVGTDIVVEIDADASWRFFSVQGVLQEMDEDRCLPLRILSFLEDVPLLPLTSSSYRVQSSALAGSCKHPLGLFLYARVGRVGFGGGEDAWASSADTGVLSCPLVHRLRLCCEDEDD